MTTRFDIDEELAADLCSAGLGSLDQLMNCSAGRRLDKPGLAGWRQRWQVRFKGVAGERCCYLKRFRRPPLAEQVRRWREGGWGWSTAGIEWRNSRDLAAAGVKATSAVAFGQRMSGPLELASAVLLAEVPGTSLERWVPAQLRPPAEEQDWATRRRRVDALAAFVARFHSAGFVHRDLYLCHVFLLDGPAGAGESHPEYCLIDLQRVFKPRWRQGRWFVKDLAALDFSAPEALVGRSDRLRFLARYAQLCPAMTDARWLARKVAARTAHLRGRQARKAGASTDRP